MGTYRVLRGGSWSYYGVVAAVNLRSASRYSYAPGGQLRYVGFRCLRTAP